MLNSVVGEERYNSLRVMRRIYSNKFYYLRQHLLYRWFVESPEVACMLGIYPKVDSSHGYGSHSIYCFKQFNTKCIEIFRKIPSTVMVLLECGLSILAQYTVSIFCTPTSFRFIGTRLQLSKMENNKELE